MGFRHLQLIQDGALTVEVSPLGEAALAGQESVFESLMEFDLDVNFAYKVHHLCGIAVLSNHFICKYFSHKVKVVLHYIVQGLVSVLCLACIGGNVNIVDYLLKTNDIDLSVGMSVSSESHCRLLCGNKGCTQCELQLQSTLTVILSSS